VEEEEEEKVLEVWNGKLWRRRRRRRYWRFGRENCGGGAGDVEIEDEEENTGMVEKKMVDKKKEKEM
jgi:hypothetical protein